MMWLRRLPERGKPEHHMQYQPMIWGIATPFILLAFGLLLNAV
jgi:hypothetical protein